MFTIVQYSLFLVNIMYNLEELHNQELKFFHFNDAVRKKKNLQKTVAIEL